MRPKILALVATALAAGAVILLELQSTRSIAADDARSAVAATRQETPAPAADTTPLVPFDVLGAGLVIWLPASHDGSNGPVP